MIATSAGNPSLLGTRRCRRIVEASVPSAHRRATSNTKQRLTASGPPEHIVKHCLSALRTPADQYPPIELDFIDCRLGVSQVPIGSQFQASSAPRVLRDVCPKRWSARRRVEAATRPVRWPSQPPTERRSGNDGLLSQKLHSIGDQFRLRDTWNSARLSWVAERFARAAGARGSMCRRQAGVAGWRVWRALTFSAVIAIAILNRRGEDNG